MRAVVVEAANAVSIKEIETPSPDVGEVLVRVHYTGVCGSDVPRVLQGRVHGFPIVLGHEFSGEVAGLGEGVNESLAGARVAGVPLVPCGHCSACEKGLYSLCSQYSFVGSRQPGSMAEYVCLPAGNVFPVDDEVDDLQAAFFEPATVAAHAVMLAGFKPGAHAVVIGAGTVGLLLAQILVARGAATVTVCNRSSARLALLDCLDGISGICMADRDWLDRVRDVAGGAADFVFDTVACSATIAAAAVVAGPRASVCFVGTPKEEVRLSVSQWELLNRKELSFTGSWMSYSAPWPGSEWDSVSKLFAQGALKIVDGMVDAIYPLRDAASAFARFEDPSSVKGKVLIDSWEA